MDKNERVEELMRKVLLMENIEIAKMILSLEQEKDKEIEDYKTATMNLLQIKEEEITALKAKVNELEEYTAHSRDCILSFLEAGEPTESGGYRLKYKGKWYQAKPVDETPKCSCGFDKALSSVLGK